MTMKINRDGVFIELTPQEMYDAYRIVKQGFTCDDVRCWIQDNDFLEKNEISEEDSVWLVGAAAELFQSCHDCNLTYWDNIEAAVRNASGIW